MSRSSNSDDPERRLDELGAMARLTEIQGWELQSVPPTGITSAPGLFRIDEDRATEWI
jgi:hypothetical protein